MNTYQWAGLGLLCIFLSCHPQKEEITVRKAGIGQSSFSTSSDESITFIYHYNPIRGKLEWTAVKVNQPSGQELKDALIALLQDFSKNKICTGLELEQLNKKAGQLIVHLNGKALLKTPQDSTIFWAALDLTMNRYTKRSGYQVVLN